MNSQHRTFEHRRCGRGRRRHAAVPTEKAGHPWSGTTSGGALPPRCAGRRRVAMLSQPRDVHTETSRAATADHGLVAAVAHAGKARLPGSCSACGCARRVARPRRGRERNGVAGVVSRRHEPTRAQASHDRPAERARCASARRQHRAACGRPRQVSASARARPVRRRTVDPGDAPRDAGRAGQGSGGVCAGRGRCRPAPVGVGSTRSGRGRRGRGRVGHRLCRIRSCRCRIRSRRYRSRSREISRSC